MTEETSQPDSNMPSRGRRRRAPILASTAAGVSRRGLVRAAGASAAVVGGGGLLEACTSSTKGAPGGSTSGSSPGLVIGPSGDTTGAADTGAINAVAGTGGTALLKKGTYHVTHLLPDSYGAILGTGPNTILQAVSGTTGYVIALKTPASTQQVMLAGFTLKPSTGSLGGIQIDNTGYGRESDPQHTLENIYVLNAGGDAFHFDNNARELKVTRCRQYGSRGFGFYLGGGLAAGGTGCTDSHFSGCTSGPSANHGWYVHGWNNMFTSCKAFFAGYSDGGYNTTGCGWEISDTQNNCFVACSAQSNALHGFDLQSNSYVTVTACECDTNSAGTTIGVGINLNGNTHCVISSNTGDNNSAASNGQKYGIQAAGAQTETVIVFNQIAGSAAAFHPVSGGGYTLMSAGAIDFTGIPVVKVPRLIYSARSPQTLSNGSTINTSNNGDFGLIPVTESSHVTGVILDPPSNGNSQVTIVNRSAYTITFAASGTSNVADGTSDIIPALAARTFTYDGGTSLWYRAG